MLDLQGFLGSGAEGLADAMAVLRSPLQRPKNQHVECPLEELDSISIWFSLGHNSLEGSLPQD